MVVKVDGVILRFGRENTRREGGAMISGGCLCGKIRYQINGRLSGAQHCHCEVCRKAHGAAFGTFTVARKKDFQWLAGEDELRGYKSSEGFLRQFCPTCGSQVTTLEDWNPKGITIAAGSLDNDVPLRIEGHMYVGSKASWDQIHDDLPQAEKWPADIRPEKS
ncbi:MAG: GFA family protein [Gammaproteobacteria bacterium]